LRRERADILLMKKGFFPSRERAKAAILGGNVFIDGRLVEKVGTLVDPDGVVSVKKEIPYVSRGGLKLEKALREFDIDVDGKVVLDVGVSTGGFTDCLLKHGAGRVIAVDVGYGHLAWPLRQDPRVYLLERTNIRHLTPDRVPAKADISTVDVSFISVEKIIENLKRLLEPGAELAILAKPQFEVGREFVEKGIVRDPNTHKAILIHLWNFFEEGGFIVKGLIFSPILGAKGNIEFFFHLSLNGGEPTAAEEIAERVSWVVDEAHHLLRKKAPGRVGEG